MPEKYITELNDAALHSIHEYAAERGTRRIDAINQLIVIGGFVSAKLLEGCEIYVKVNGQLHEIDWQIAQARQDGF